MTPITEHFTLEELTASKTAEAKGLPNEPNAVQTVHLCRLVYDILEPFRLVWGDAIEVTSGFRGFEKIQKLEHSSATSVHPEGLAVDIRPKNMSRIKEFKQRSRDWLHETGAKYDQYIDEKRGASEWVHLGLTNAAGKQRLQDLITTDGKNYRLLPRWTKKK
jgi:hypothetical protein